jgi:hypothetical protein
LTAGSVAVAEPPARPPAEKKTDAAPPPPSKTTDKPAAKPTEAAKAKADTLPDEVAKKFVEFFDKLTSIVVSTKDDCTAMAAGVNAHVDANQALLALINEAKAQHKSLSEADKARIARKSSEELAPAMMKKCSNDRPVMTAFLRITPKDEDALARDREREKKQEKRIERKRKRLREEEGH